MTDDKVIRASTPNSNRYDGKIDIYSNDPSQDHDSIHIAVEKDKKSAHIIEKTDGKTTHSDVSCYLTTACMRHLQEKFNDNCYELMVLRWFRDNFVSNEDIKLYYDIAPTIVENIEKLNEAEKDNIYNYIYEYIVYACVKAIEQKKYEFAYKRYKDSVIALTEIFGKREEIDKNNNKTKSLRRNTSLT